MNEYGVTIYCYVGVIGSGKDFCANEKARVTNGIKLGFSDGVREYTFDFLGWKPKDNREYELWKDSDFKMTYGGGIFEGKGRDFLTRVGTKMREYDPDFWVDYTMQNIHYWIEKGVDSIIVPDCRYINEAQALADLAYSSDRIGLEFKLCNRYSPRYKITNHESERFAQKVLDYETEHLADINNVVKKILKYAEDIPY